MLKENVNVNRKKAKDSSSCIPEPIGGVPNCFLPDKETCMHVCIYSFSIYSTPTVCQALETKSCIYYAYILRLYYSQMSKAINSYQLILMEGSVSRICGSYHFE